ncbi:MAG: DUF362 domain-containing protein [Verrucomicrobia bacterium]|nr:DUF362 domain-containing protein [Verrucomicrobiota bacterium]
MTMRSPGWTRREFLRGAAAVAAAAPLPFAFGAGLPTTDAAGTPPNVSAQRRPDTKVAIVSCTAYGPEVRAAMKEALDLLGGLGSLVKGKTVTVKLNLTGTDFTPFLDRPVGETFITHEATALALVGLLFDAGARRVRFAESTQSRSGLADTLALAKWDVNALRALGRIEFENTRNLGSGKQYAELKVPDGGRMFSSFQLNHAYAETDVMVSLCKLKQHVTTGVTLSMKNLFGLTPNSLYGDEAGSEDATAGRGVIHAPGDGWDPKRFEQRQFKLPGLKPAKTLSSDPGVRVPRTIVDLCAARPVHLAIIDGITAMCGGEGPWCGNVGPMRLMKPGILIVGLNPVATDAVGAAVMGADDPRAPRGTPPFRLSENHLLLAEQAGLGPADLAQIEVLGRSVEKALCPYPPLKV